MTLVIGTICADGMVFCSDTEETTPMGGKRFVHKLYWSGASDWTMFIGAAGHPPLCDLGAKEIQGLASSVPSFKDEHLEPIKKWLKDLHEQYIFPFPDEKQRARATSFVIGIQGEKTAYLYKTSEEILQPFEHCACAGSGEDVAYYFLERLFDPSLNVFETEKLLTFIVREAKASVGYVGRETEFHTIMRNGTGGGVIVNQEREAKVPQLTECIRKFWKE